MGIPEISLINRHTFVFALKTTFCICLLSSTIYFFFGPNPPKGRVSDTFIWLLPIIIPGIISSICLITQGVYLGLGTPPTAEPSYHERPLDQIQCALCSITQSSIIFQSGWSVLRNNFSDLKPYDPHGGENASFSAWAELGLATTFVTILGAVGLALTWVPFFGGLKKQATHTSLPSEEYDIAVQEEE